MKVPNGCTVEKVKTVRNKVTGYELRQGVKSWSGKTVADAIAARDAEIADACAEYAHPIILPSPHSDDPIGSVVVAYLTIGGWWYGFARPYYVAGEPATERQYTISGSGFYRTRRECERKMRCHAADIAIRIGPAPECAVLCDGFAYLRGCSAIDVEDVKAHCVRLAVTRAYHVAKARGMRFGTPSDDGDRFVAQAGNAESCRVHEIASKQSHYTYTAQWIELLAPKAEVRS